MREQSPSTPPAPPARHAGSDPADQADPADRADRAEHADPANQADAAEREPDGEERDSLGLRELKKRATREALQLAALELVAERGLDGVTVEDITTTVGVSPRTFFNYFPTKEDALVGADPDILDHFLTALRQRPAGETPLASLRAVLLSDSARIEASRDRWRLRMALTAEHPEIFHAAASASARIDSALAEVLAKRSATDLNTSPLPRLVTGIASAVRRTALHLWARGDFTEPYPDVIARCFDELSVLLPEESPAGKEPDTGPAVD